MKFESYPWDNKLFDGQTLTLHLNRRLRTEATDFSQIQSSLTQNNIVFAAAELYKNDNYYNYNNNLLRESKFVPIVDYLKPKLVLPTYSKNLIPSEFSLLEKPYLNQQCTKLLSTLFEYERFALDPLISHKTNHLRFYNWIRSCCQGNKDQTLFGFYQLDILVGICIIKCPPLDINNTSQLMLNAILPNFQGQGYGSKMIQCAIQLLTELGYIYLTSSVSDKNLSALRLWNNLGAKVEEKSTWFHYHKPTNE